MGDIEGATGEASITGVIDAAIWGTGAAVTEASIQGIGTAAIEGRIATGDMTGSAIEGISGEM